LLHFIIFITHKTIASSITKEEGSGLGLAIVKKIIDEHEGKISVEREAGRGTRVVVSL